MISRAIRFLERDMHTVEHDRGAELGPTTALPVVSPAASLRSGVNFGVGWAWFGLVGTRPVPNRFCDGSVQHASLSDLVLHIPRSYVVLGS